jgi:hypothetical protein
VKLRGTTAKEGREKPVSPATIGLAVLPAGLLLERGNEAGIKQGTALTAIVEADIARSAHE